MEKRLQQAGSLKKGSYVIFDDTACVVKDIQISKTGKHGSAKCRIEAISMIDDKKIIKVMPSKDNVSVPIIEKLAAQVLSVHGNFATVMDMKNYETFDIKIPEDFQGQVKEGNDVVFWKIMEEKVIKQIK